MHIDDSTSIGERVNKAAARDFFLSNDIPRPEEVGESVAFIPTTKPNKLRTYWGAKLKLAAEYVGLTKGIQRIWDNAAPPEVKSATGRAKSIAISALLKTTTVVAPYGCRSSPTAPMIGDLSQEGVFHRDTPPSPRATPRRGDLAKLPTPLQTTFRDIRLPARRCPLGRGEQTGQTWMVGAAPPHLPGGVGGHLRERFRRYRLSLSKPPNFAHSTT